MEYTRKLDNVSKESIIDSGIKISGNIDEITYAEIFDFLSENGIEVFIQYNFYRNKYYSRALDKEIDSYKESELYEKSFNAFRDAVVNGMYLLKEKIERIPQGCP